VFESSASGVDFRRTPFLPRLQAAELGLARAAMSLVTRRGSNVRLANETYVISYKT